MPKKLLLGALTLLLAAFGLRAYVKIMEPRYLFHPQRGVEVTPAFWDIEFQEVSIKSGNDVLNGWWMPKKEQIHGVIVFYHGNGGNMADWLGFFRFISKMKVGVLAIDYRGFGKSTGAPSIEGLEEDAVSTLRWVIAQGVPPNRIALWGYSMGASAALKAAEQNPGVAGVIVESGFISMRAMAMDIHPWLPVALVTDGFDNGAKVERIKTPKLFIHGTADKVVPFYHGETLYKRAIGPKRFLPVTGAGHHDVYTRGGARYFKAVEDWLYPLLLGENREGGAIPGSAGSDSRSTKGARATLADG